MKPAKPGRVVGLGGCFVLKTDQAMEDGKMVDAVRVFFRTTRNSRGSPDVGEFKACCTLRGGVGQIVVRRRELLDWSVCIETGTPMEELCWGFGLGVGGLGFGIAIWGASGAPIRPRNECGMRAQAGQGASPPVVLSRSALSRTTWG